MLTVADAARLGPRRRWELRCVGLDTMDGHVFAELRLAVRRRVGHMPHQALHATLGEPRTGKERLFRWLQICGRPYFRKREARPAPIQADRALVLSMGARAAGATQAERRRYYEFVTVVFS